MTDRQNLIVFIICIIVLTLIYAFSFTLEESSRDLLLKEASLIESASALGYFLCAALILYKGKLAYLRKHNYFFFLVILLGFRELDFDKQFTTMGILKSKFYVSYDVPNVEKVIGLMVILLLVYIIFSIFKNHFKQFRTGLRNYSVISFGALISTALLVISKILDGLARKLKPLGIELTNQLSIHLVALEEILELGIPIFLTLTFYAYFKQLKV